MQQLGGRRYALLAHQTPTVDGRGEEPFLRNVRSDSARAAYFDAYDKAEEPATHDYTCGGCVHFRPTNVIYGWCEVQNDEFCANENDEELLNGCYRPKE